MHAQKMSKEKLCPTVAANVKSATLSYSSQQQEQTLPLLELSSLALQ